MYLKSLTINNFRKFGTSNNKVEFVDANNLISTKGKMNIAPTTTLIVGKNNSGKTTIIHALEKLINEKKFKANDFNFNYIKTFLTKINSAPYLEFTINVAIESDSKDLVTNLVPFMTISNSDNSNLEIIIKYELAEEHIFLSLLKEITKSEASESIKFNKLLELIDTSDFKLKYYNGAGDNINFNINDLVELKSIKANNIENNKSLSSAFSKIVEYRYNSILKEEDKKKLEDEIDIINETLTKNISENHTTGINASLGTIESSKKLQVLLSSDLSFKKLMSNLIRYEYVEGEHAIPENQYGLGYTNLVTIIAELIDYIEKYPEISFNSRLNLIAIEEPETFMHPQMQELFIKHISDAISSLLKGKDKDINSQLIVTTHSSHILNSKIHSGNTFNNINYINTVNKKANITTLNDDNVQSAEEKRETKKSNNNLKFLKKHIRYKVSELFFSDAAIFVEGITEDTLLRYYIDNDETLNKHYVSIFNINGAHGLVYHELIKLLKVPTLIITDLDIKRTDDEKDQFKQITNLKDRITTNETLKKYFKSEKLVNIPKEILTDNIRIAFQGKISGYYATSFEEAFILTNYKNDKLNEVLARLKPKIFEDIVGKDEKALDALSKNSYKMQRKLSSSKSDFANDLLYEFIICSDKEKIPPLPEYISSGLKWLADELNGNNK
tara:strand:- start:24627 stop:26642 length:2016 start_codon:yes stop_codon:yes gene_type:complete